MRGISYVIAGLGACLLLKAFYIQVIHADATAGAGALALQADGERRYEYNPRLLAVAHSIPRGTIYDRNGIPLATSNWNEIAQNRDRYSGMGLSVGEQPAAGAKLATIRLDQRHSICLEICGRASTGPHAIVPTQSVISCAPCRAMTIVRAL